MIKKHAGSYAFEILQRHIENTRLQCPAFSYLEKTNGQKQRELDYDQVIEYAAFTLDLSALQPKTRAPN